jgi:hypothetical protein
MNERASGPTGFLVPCRVVACLSVLLLATSGSQAATPPSGNVSTAAPNIAWDFAPVVAGQFTNAGIQDVCPPGVCDNYDLTVSLPQPADTFYQTMTATLTLHYEWTSSVGTDMDMFAISPSGAEYGPGSPDGIVTGPGFSDIVITDPIDGLWHVRETAALVPVPTAAHATASLTVAVRTSPPTPKIPPGAPRYANHPADDKMTPALGSTDNGAHGAGEPSIGVNWKSGAVFIEAGNHTLRAVFDAAGNPAWTDVRSPFARVSLDPILWADSQSGRIFESQLDGACSTTSYTEDDGVTWVPTEGCGTPAGPDHQTLGGGAYAAPKPAVTTWPRAVYYCSQGIAAAICARSDDGGVTFGPGVPIYNLTQCGGLHGHIRVGPDGTAYVPNSSCGTNQGVAVSADNGLSWTVRTVPRSRAYRNGGDPSVSAGANGTVYFGYVDADGHPKIALSSDRGATWTKEFDVGQGYGLQNGEFSEVIAGDDDRAAFAFLGSTTPGDNQSSDFKGVWHLYVASTFNRGKTWVTADITPTDPVQRGCIWNGGGDNQCRNLLDFNDITVDAIGRVLVGYADGCTGACVSDATQNTFDAWATIARQTTGKTLFSRFDGTLPNK